MNDEIRIDEALLEASQKLSTISESPRLDAELLLAQALDVARSYLFAYPEDSLDAAATERFFSTIRRRAKGEPLAYIHGEKEFWSLTLMVSPDTLVPRPETETLVQEALALISRRESCAVLDLGTGSGAIALAIASERPLAQVTATDISEAALAIARENARQLEISNITFVAGNWIEPVRGQRFEVIASNPPYVATGDEALRALSYEPLSALVSGRDGLLAIRQLAEECATIVQPGGTLLLEHGANQADAVAAILSAAGWEDVRCTQDLAGLPRVTTASATAKFEDSGNHSS